MKRFTILFLACYAFSVSFAQADDVLKTAQQTNDYFMSKYSDPTVPTNVKRIRPSSLWTRAVYYEGLMALYAVDPQQRYIDYTDRWASFHQWTPRNGIKTCDADDQCCGQTYLERYMQSGGKEKIEHMIENLDLQMQTANKKADNALYGWWTWIDAIQMAMPLYLQVGKVTEERKYTDHAMRMYRWSRDTLADGLFNKKEGLWWRDKDYVPPYKEKDGKNCYWSRGNGWVYAALVRCMNLLSPKDKYYKELKRDFLLMSKALLECQHADGFWHASLVSDADYPTPEMTGTALFLYGMAWGIQQGLLKENIYRPACDKAWQALKSCIHKDGFLGWNQGTGKDPSAGQPVTFTSVPDFEDYGTGCYLLGLSEYYKLLTR
ncbi:MAG: glycoside hydrolase family 88 protein [Prevotella sp.]|nr:glycoside hydrolase family 88 protein [Prevotella sp.]